MVKVERGEIYARRLAKWLYKLLQLVPKGGGGSEWHKTPMWQMHITPSLWPFKVQWSRWREVEFMLGGWQSGYRSC